MSRAPSRNGKARCKTCIDLCYFDNFLQGNCLSGTRSCSATRKEIQACMSGKCRYHLVDHFRHRLHKCQHTSCRTMVHDCHYLCIPLELGRSQHKSISLHLHPSKGIEEYSLMASRRCNEMDRWSSILCKDTRSQA